MTNAGARAHAPADVAGAEASATLAFDGPLPILWRDEHLIAIHKPAGWLVHRTGLDAGESRFVVQTLRGQLGGRHVWPVHRLDKGTCGVLLLALHAEAARRLGEAFADGAVHKRYLALVRGWAPAVADVDHPLRPEDSPPGVPAQPAFTHLERMACFDWPESADPRFPSTRASLVLAEPHTGRRHQIRRHLKHLAHPILGDATHGKGPLNRWWAERLAIQRLWLHAWHLKLRHPMTGQALDLDSGLLWDGARLHALAPREHALRDWTGLVLAHLQRIDHSAGMAGTAPGRSETKSAERTGRLIR